MYPLTEDEVSGYAPHPRRQVRLRVGPAEPWPLSGVTWQVAGWVWDFPDYYAATVWVTLLGRPERGGLFSLKDMGLDPSPHLAFCRGDMPAAVYADWLEENVRDFPAVGLALLRGWLSEKEGMISYKGEGDE